VGEIDSGKTSLANQLLDEPVLPVGVLANTRRPQVMHYSDTMTVSGVIAGRSIDLLGNGKPNLDRDLDCIEIGLPSRRLKRFDLVDTPGNSPSPRFDPTFLPTSDLLLWCTLATQAWKESERGYWMSLPMRHQRNGILVATHKDCLQGEGEANQVRSRLAAETATCFRTVVLVGKSQAGSKPSTDNGLAELDERISEALAAISKRRIAAAYRIAGHVVRRALLLLKSEPPAVAPPILSVLRPAG
jgi:hypothetical protein